MNEEMTLSKAYEMVLNDIIENKSGLMVGKFDPTSGGEKFMYGILMVMENIAYGVSEEKGMEFSSTFLENMARSR